MDRPNQTHRHPIIGLNPTPTFALPTPRMHDAADQTPPSATSLTQTYSQQHPTKTLYAGGRWGRHLVP